MTLSQYDSIIFDLDGTLWDAAETCAIAWNDLLKQKEIADYTFQADEIRAVSGLNINRVFKEHFTFIPEERRMELLEAYKPMELEYMAKWGGVLYPEVREVLTELKRTHSLYVVSNCLSGYIENFIQFHKLEGIFTDFECSGNTGLPKSDNIRSIVDRNNLKAPVYVGDTVWDMEAANSAGVPFIYAEYGFGKVENNDLQIERFADLVSK